MSAARVTELDAAVLERLRTEQLRDALEDAAPHALLATSPGARNRLRTSPAVPDELSILSVQGGQGGTARGRRSQSGDDEASTVHRFGDVDVVVAGSDADLAAVATLAPDE